MGFDSAFQLANASALLCWSALILLPRRPALRLAIRSSAVGGLCIAYAVLVALYFFRVPGGGFGSLQAVQRLFASPPVALAGWLHYLAFDLLAGLWIAGRSDAMGLSRWLQAPLLFTTFMFGPVGWLLFSALDAAAKGRAADKAWR